MTNARVLTSMRAMFRRDYEVLLANSGQEAIDLLRDHTVDVIVSDQRMPGMTGVEVLKAVKLLAPNAMRILLTGYADLKAIEASINEGEVFRYLTKPCPSEELKEAIGLAADIAASSDPAEAETARAARAMPTGADITQQRHSVAANSPRSQPTAQSRTRAGRTDTPRDPGALTPIMRRPAQPHVRHADRPRSRTDIRRRRFACVDPRRADGRGD